MKIVHLCLASFFPDGYSYQENMLPKFHKKLGYDVEVITSLFTFDNEGKEKYYEKATIYLNEYDIKVIRLEYHFPRIISKKMKIFIGLEHALEKAKPDILFIHGCQFLDVDSVIKYKKEYADKNFYG